MNSINSINDSKRVKMLIIEDERLIELCVSNEVYNNLWAK